MKKSALNFLLVFLPLRLLANARFPQPQFDSGHIVPQAHHPPFTTIIPAWADVLFLIGALMITVWLVRKLRSRYTLLAFSFICLVWFGFIRQGCLCPIGAIQNIAVTACHGGGLPWHAAALFALPLLTAILFGRIFCATTCPLGALQDLFIIKPLHVPRPLDAVLRLIPLIVLSLGIVYAINGAGYLICRTDPFVGFFRRSAPISMLIIGTAILFLGMLVARPYCRYFCPYGVLLELCALKPWKPVALTMSTCINCHLCVNTCPVDAIARPRPALNDHIRLKQFKRFLMLLALTPFLILGGSAAGWFSGAFFAQSHPEVYLLKLVNTIPAEAEDLHPELEVLKNSQRSYEQVQTRAAQIIHDFKKDCAWAGLFIGTIIALRLLGLLRLQSRDLHEVNSSRCIACGRCFAACPKNHPSITPTSDHKIKNC